MFWSAPPQRWHCTVLDSSKIQNDSKLLLIFSTPNVYGIFGQFPVVSLIIIGMTYKMEPKSGRGIRFKVMVA